MKVDWETFLWTIISLVSLVAVLFFSWVFRVPPAGLSGDNEQEARELQREAGGIEINLEEAQISKLSGTEKVWELATRSLQRRDERLLLDEVTGYLYKDQAPHYRVEADQGWVDLDTQQVILETVFLSALDGRGNMQGKVIEWKGDDRVFHIRNFLFESAESRIEAEQARYDVTAGKVELIENVEIRMKLGD